MFEVLQALVHALWGIVPLGAGEVCGGTGRRGTGRMLFTERSQHGGIQRVMDALRREVADGLTEGSVAHQAVKDGEERRGGEAGFLVRDGRGGGSALTLGRADTVEGFPSQRGGGGGVKGVQAIQDPFCEGMGGGFTPVWGREGQFGKDKGVEESLPSRVGGQAMDDRGEGKAPLVYSPAWDMTEKANGGRKERGEECR